MTWLPSPGPCLYLPVANGVFLRVQNTKHKNVHTHFPTFPKNSLFISLLLIRQYHYHYHHHYHHHYFYHYQYHYHYYRTSSSRLSGDIFPLSQFTTTHKVEKTLRHWALILLDTQLICKTPIFLGLFPTQLNAPQTSVFVSVFLRLISFFPHSLLVCATWTPPVGQSSDRWIETL